MGGSIKQIKKALSQPPRRRKEIPEEERLWYQKKRIALNSKLRQEIIDVLPFDIDKKRADRIIHTIFDMITDCVVAGGSITITGFGRFYLKRRLPKSIPVTTNRAASGGKYVLGNVGRKRKKTKGRYELGFRPSKVMKRSLYDEEYRKVYE